MKPVTNATALVKGKSMGNAQTAEVQAQSGLIVAKFAAVRAMLPFKIIVQTA